MLAYFDQLRTLTFASIVVRMVLATICGGLVGLERENKRRPAGFRTHILICLGACMTTLTGQYLYGHMQYYTDISRLGAQVIAGIGFVGAGTIIVTKRHRVRGLTTAAGLWTSAIVGLACGAGYYEGAISGAFLILLVEILFSRLEYWITSHSRELNLYVKYTENRCLDDMVALLKDHRVKVLDLEIVRPENLENDSICAIFLLRPEKKIDSKNLLLKMRAIPSVQLVELL